jgi:hypothetical protein
VIGNLSSAQFFAPLFLKNVAKILTKQLKNHFADDIEVVRALCRIREHALS